MPNEVLLKNASTGSTIESEEIEVDGSSFNLHMQADNYGTDGKFVIKARADHPDADFITLRDPNTSSGLAEYESNEVAYIDRLTQGCRLRVDFVITAGAALVVLAIKTGG